MGSPEQVSLFGDESPRLERLSFSRVELYLQCPYRYSQHYLHGRIHKKQDMFYLGLGRAIHASLREIMQTVSTPTSDKQREVLEKHWNKGAFASVSESDRWLEKAEVMVARYMTEHGESAMPVMFEAPFKFPYGSWLMTGRIDRVDKLGVGYEVVDYKVGSEDEVPTVDQLQGGLQWVFYWLALDRHYSIQPTAVSFCYLAAGRRLRFEPTHAEAAAAKTRLEQVVADMSAATVFPPTANRECMSCLFSRECGVQAR